MCDYIKQYMEESIRQVYIYLSMTKIIEMNMKTKNADCVIISQSAR